MRVVSGAVPLWIDVVDWVRRRRIPWGYTRPDDFRLVVADGGEAVTKLYGLERIGETWLFNARITPETWPHVADSFAYLDRCDLRLARGAGHGNGLLVAHTRVHGELGGADSLQHIRDCDVELDARGTEVDVATDCRFAGTWRDAKLNLLTGCDFRPGTDVLSSTVDQLIRCELHHGDWLGTKVAMLIRPHLHLGAFRGADLEGASLISPHDADTVDTVLGAYVTAASGGLRPGHADPRAQVVDTWGVVTDPEPTRLTKVAAWEYTLTRVPMRASDRERLRQALRNAGS